MWKANGCQIITRKQRRIFNTSRFQFNGTARFTNIRYALFAVILQTKKLGKMRATFKIMCLTTIALIIRTLEVASFRIGNGLETT